ncbi:MAG TPA: RNA 2',3'-cyclic phosphodiesterase [Vicinamibacterales bacterium]|nr:RNA 2',3'-cyclic phosphodiesterase [Vicinamibacterales bacterium]
MRLFVAVDIAPAVAEAAAALIEQLRERAIRLAPRSRISWVTADRLHVTVRFIGNVDADRADAVRRVLAPPLGQAPFDLTLAGVRAFPPKGPPRVLWSDVSNGREPLLAIEQRVGERLARTGIAAEERPYNPHLTLARVREAVGLRSAALLESAAETTLGTTAVEAITLFESRLSPKGPTYVALQRTSL